jgi:ATP-dependent Lhr-like helicase
MAGEQFALPDAVPVLREVRRTPASGTIYSISTADPLNLAGIVTAGTRLRTAGRNRVAYRDGVPVAAFENQVFRTLVPLDAEEAAAAAHAVSGRPKVRPHRSAAALS